MNSARAGSAARCTAGTSAIIIAIAPVPCTTMNADDVVERAADRADHVPVQAGKRVHPREQAGRQTVGHALHPEHEPGHCVLPQRPPAEPERAPHIVSRPRTISSERREPLRDQLTPSTTNSTVETKSDSRSVSMGSMIVFYRLHASIVRGRQARAPARAERAALMRSRTIPAPTPARVATPTVARQVSVADCGPPRPSTSATAVNGSR